MTDGFGPAHTGAIQLAAVHRLHGRRIVGRVLPSGTVGLNMEIRRIIQDQQSLMLFGPGRGVLDAVGNPFCFCFRHQLVQTVQQLGGLFGHFPGIVLIDDVLEPVSRSAGFAAAQCDCQFFQRILTVIHGVMILIRIVVKGKLVDVLSQHFDGVTLLLRRGSQVNAALLADLLVVALDVVNQLAGSLVDGLQAGPQLFQLLALGPGCNIAKAVFSGLDSKILADRIGDAFCLHFLGVAILGGLLCRRPIFFHFQPPLKPILVHKAPAIFGGGLFRLCFGGKVQTIVLFGAAFAYHDNLPCRLCLILFGVMELAVCHLMDGGRDGLHLAHPFPDGDSLLIGGEIAVQIGIQRLKLDGDRSGAPQGFQKCLIVRHCAGKFGCQFRQGLTVCLAYIEHFDRAEHGDFDFPFLHDCLAVCIQDRSLGVRVPLHLLDPLFIRRGSDDGNAMLSLFHMAAKLIFPFVVPCHQSGVRALHINQHGVVDGIAVKLGHDRQIVRIFLTLEQVLDALLDACRDFLQPLPAGGFVGHDFHAPFHSCDF